MNLQSLRYLVALADCRHFGKAAEKCYVSQPTLSMQIKKLEEELGVKLLERTQKSVLLTEIGTELAQRARNVLQEIASIETAAKSATDPYSGNFKLGIIPTLAPYLLPSIIPALIKHLPQLTYYLVEEQTALLLEKLKKGTLDAAILALPVLEKNFIEAPLFEEEFLLALPKNHPLATRPSIQAKELAYLNLLLLEEGHCLRDQALEFCSRLNIEENKDFRATSLETLRYMVAAGAGVTLMPKLACTPNKKIAYVPFANKKPTRHLGLIWRQTSPRSVVMREVLACIRKV